jgi:hypothetical protein
MRGPLAASGSLRIESEREGCLAIVPVATVGCATLPPPYRAEGAATYRGST